MVVAKALEKKVKFYSSSDLKKWNMVRLHSMVLNWTLW